MAAKDEREKEVNGNQEKKRSGVMMIIIAAVGALFVGGLIMGVIVYNFGIPGVVPKMKSAKPPEYETMEIGERVVNLSDTGGSHYLRIRMVFEYKKDEKLTEEIKELSAPIMEDIIHVLRSKTVDDIRPLDKEEKVKVEILNSINARLTHGKVEKIYFTDFLIQ